MCVLAHDSRATAEEEPLGIGQRECQAARTPDDSSATLKLKAREVPKGDPNPCVTDHALLVGALQLQVQTLNLEWLAQKGSREI